MRVYELAKELGLSSKDLVVALKDAGIAVSSHMSVIAEQDVARARQIMTKSAKSSMKNEDIASRGSQKIVKEEALKKKSENKESSRSHVSSVDKKENKSSFVSSVDSSIHQNSKKVDMTDPVKTTHLNEKPVKGSFKKPPHHQGPVSKQRSHHDIASAALEVDSVDEDTASPGGVVIDETILEKLGNVPLPIHAKGQEKFTRIFSEKKRPSSRRRRRSGNRVQQEQTAAALKIVTEYEITGPVRVGDLADALNKPAGDVILNLLKRGMACTINHVIQPEMTKTIVEHYGVKAIVSSKTTIATEGALEQSQQLMRAKKSPTEGAVRRPVVVVMGHVDHGKTTLLDYIRKKNVAASEKGGITQHLGAYEVATKQGSIVFLDTPGHEAFSYIRSQGSKITDIAILVIAADDGIKPQTVEAINHAKEAGVPIIIAINKIDKVKSTSALDTIKRQLATQYDLMTEDWGGQVICVPISAKTGEGVEDLLEMVVLQSQMMDLKAPTNVSAKVFVLESHVEKGFGPVATGIVVVGILKQGDFFMCGDVASKIRLLVDSHGKRLTQAEPSVPVKIVGFDTLTGIDEWLSVVTAQEYSKYRNNPAALEAQKSFATQTKDVLQQFNNVATQQGAAQQKSINLILKTDTRGSKEALAGMIEKLARENKEINCAIRVIMSGIGDISEGDVDLAMNTGAYLIGLHVKTEKNAQILARDKNVSIYLHDIIYHLVEFLQVELNKRREVKVTWEKAAELVVRKVFDIKGLGVIAGCYVREGVIARGNKVICIRNGKVIGEAKINSLQRDKKTVKEVHSGYECGFICDAFTDWQENDTVHVMRESKVEPK
ncbi:translation initiation factor IF-2 [Candidatus Dependentiae bacterium]|nr:translation initiation factor IF-2 [Candidatus Dependentiae bacterium]